MDNQNDRDLAEYEQMVEKLEENIKLLAEDVANLVSDSERQEEIREKILQEHASSAKMECDLERLKNEIKGMKENASKLETNIKEYKKFQEIVSQELRKPRRGFRKNIIKFFKRKTEEDGR